MDLRGLLNSTCRRKQTVVLLLAVLLLLAPGLSCAQPAEEESAVTTEWSADGVVSPGEYARILDNGGHRLHWTTTAGSIRIAIEADTDGWIAIGFQGGHDMKDADLVLGTVVGSRVDVIDSYSTGTRGPHMADAELGGSDDVLVYGGRESNGTTVIEFERSLDTGDKYDARLEPGVASAIIWAYGSSDVETSIHSKRGHGEMVP